MRALASVCGAGYLPYAPGTWGSLVALPLAYGLHRAGGVGLFLLVTATLFGLGYSAIQRLQAEQDIGKDPSWVVVDEVVGQWIALLPISLGASHVGMDMLALWPGFIAAFALFRLFDIWKPGLVGRADRMEGPMGVMLDDVVAGVYAALATTALGALFHLVLI